MSPSFTVGRSDDVHIYSIHKSIEEKGSFVEYDKKFSDIYKYEQCFADRIALKLGNEEYFIFQNISSLLDISFN